MDDIKLYAKYEQDTDIYILYICTFTFKLWSKFDFDISLEFGSSHSLYAVEKM